MTSSVANEPSSIRLTLTLGLAGLISGMLLVGAHEITLPLIKANEAAAMKKAVLNVVPGAVQTKRLESSDGGFVEAVEGSESPVFGAYDGAGRLKGYALLGQGPGFQDVIVLIYGYDPLQRTVTGLEIIDSRETPGLGDKIFRDPDFRGAFTALAVAPEVKVIKGGGASEPNEVDAITGATISSRAVVNIVNATNRDWLPLLDTSGRPKGSESDDTRDGQ